MLRRILQAAVWLMMTGGILCLGIIGPYVLPNPITRLDPVVALLTLVLIFRERGSIVWMAFIVYFGLEFFSLAPFGALLAAGTLTWLIAYWLYEYFFTNQSWYTAMVLSAISTIVLHVLLYLLWNAFLLMESAPLIAFLPYALETFYEALATSVSIGSVYGLSIVIRKQTPQYNIFLHS